MQYTQDQLAHFKAAFALRRRRQMLATVPLVVAVFVAATADASAGTTLVGIPTDIALPLCVATAVGTIVFALWNWRCPACNAYLGKAMSPSFCSHCGAPLR